MFARELTTDEDEWSFAQDPTWVEASGLFYRVVNRWIEHGDDRHVVFDCTRDQHWILVHLDHSLGEAGLTSSGRPVEEDGAF